MNLNAIKREVCPCGVERDDGVWRRVWWDSAGRGSGWVRNMMYDDLFPML